MEAKAEWAGVGREKGKPFILYERGILTCFVETVSVRATRFSVMLHLKKRG